MNMERGIADETVLKSDSIDDFEHLEHVAAGGNLGLIDVGQTVSLVDAAATKLERNLLDTTIPEASPGEFLKPTPATPPPSAEFGKFILDPNQSNINQDKLVSFGDSNYYNNQLNMEQSEEKIAKVDAKLTTMSFIETERGGDNFNECGSFDKNMLKGNVGDIDLLFNQQTNFHDDDDEDDDDTENKKDEIIKPEKDQFISGLPEYPVDVLQTSQETGKKNENILNEIGSSSVLPVVPDVSQNLLANDCFQDECKLPTDADSTFTLESDEKNDSPWNSNEDLQPPTKPLPPVPANDYDSDPVGSYDDDNQANESDESEFESEIESSPIKVSSSQVSSATSKVTSTTTTTQPIKRIVNTIDDEIAPSQIFSNIGLDAWFNPERLNPRVAALIYWRQPEETGIVFGGILGILLSLVYFSLISVFSYVALLSLLGTFGYRIYKTVMQAVQKTSDGHPFKDILEYDLTVPAEKIHEIADIAVAHLNASVSELRRLFLIEDFIDSLKFGVVLWSLTHVGSWFNGMTIIIIGVVALFTLPKIYETNKVQIDQNLALVQAKINELTAKVKAAIPLGKKIEPAKEE